MWPFSTVGKSKWRAQSALHYVMLLGNRGEFCETRMAARVLARIAFLLLKANDRLEPPSLRSSILLLLLLLP